MPHLLANQQRPTKKEKPSKHNPENRKNRLCPKSINHTTAKYPSPPDVEGAPARPARLTAHGTSPESRLKERTQTAPKTKSLKAESSAQVPRTRACPPEHGAAAALHRGQACRDPGPGRNLPSQRRDWQFRRRSGAFGCSA